MANAPFAHLSPPARAQAELDNAERVRSLRRDRWIDYPRASEALRLLQRLLETPPRERMPCMLLHGDSNIGKTLISGCSASTSRPARCAAGRCASSPASRTRR